MIVDAAFFECTFPCVIFKNIYTVDILIICEFASHSLLITSYFCDDH